MDTVHVPNLYVVAHGNFQAGEDTFVPAGVTLYFYVARNITADRSVTLAKMGLQSFAEACGQESPVEIYAETGKIPNYTLKPIDLHDQVVSFAVIEDSAAGSLFFVKETTPFCTSQSIMRGRKLVEQCRDGVHRCKGALAWMTPGMKVHIVCCRNEVGRLDYGELSPEDREVMKLPLEFIAKLLTLIQEDTAQHQRYSGQAAALVDAMYREQPYSQGVIAIASYHPTIREWLEGRGLYTVAAENREAYLLSQDLETLELVVNSSLAHEIPYELLLRATARVEYQKKGADGLQAYFESLDNDKERSYILEDEYFRDKLDFLSEK